MTCAIGWINELDSATYANSGVSISPEVLDPDPSLVATFFPGWNSFSGLIDLTLTGVRRLEVFAAFGLPGGNGVSFDIRFTAGGQVSPWLSGQSLLGGGGDPAIWLPPVAIDTGSVRIEWRNSGAQSALPTFGRVWAGPLWRPRHGWRTGATIETVEPPVLATNFNKPLLPGQVGRVGRASRVTLAGITPEELPTALTFMMQVGTRRQILWLPEVEADAATLRLTGMLARLKAAPSLSFDTFPLKPLGLALEEMF